MRKLVILGLCALSFGYFSSSAFAGNVEECEQLKGGTPGLYGLCLAYANAGNDKARERIAENYAKKMEAGDPTLEEIFDEGATCPCWVSPEYLADVTAGASPTFCAEDLDDTSYELVFYLDGGLTVNLSAGFLPGDPYDGQTGCVINDRGAQFDTATTADEDEACRLGLESLIAMDFGGSCP